MPDPLSAENPASHLPVSGWLSPEFEHDLVSIIVPTYNRSRWIGETIDCLEAQTWPHLEIIVVDDGSSDNTIELLRNRPAPRTGHTLIILEQSNTGVSAARNHGTRVAQGEFISYIDSDDLIFPETIARYVEAIRAHDADYCFAPIDMTDQFGNPTEKRRRYHPRADTAEPMFECFWLPHGAFYRRTVINAAGPWNEMLRRNEDHQFIWRIHSVAGQGYLLQVVQGIYRQHSDDQLHNSLDTRNFFETRLHSLDLFTDWLRQEDRFDSTISLRLARQYLFIGTRLANCKEPVRSRHAFAAARHHAPTPWHPVYLSAALQSLVPFQLIRFISETRHRLRTRQNQTPSRSLTKKRPPACSAD